MKIKTALAFLVLGAVAFATPRTFTVSFESPDIGDPTVDFLVEVKRPDGTWRIAATGAKSPVVYSEDAPAGRYVVRVVARSSAFNPPAVSPPSAEAVQTLGLSTPVNVKIVAGPAGGGNPTSAKK